MTEFHIGVRVEKKSGSSWRGIIVGSYSTALTPVGWAVESETEIGSVQIYPEKALRVIEQSPPVVDAGGLDIEAIVSRSVQQVMNGFSFETLVGPENLRARLSLAARQAIHDTIARTTLSRTGDEK